MPGVKYEQDGTYFGPEGDEVVTEDDTQEQTGNPITGMNKADVMKYLDARQVEYDKKQGVKALQKIARETPAEPPLCGDYIVVDGVIVRPEEDPSEQPADQSQATLEGGGGLFDGGGSASGFEGTDLSGDDSFPDSPASGGVE